MNHSGAGATGRRLGRYHLAEPLGGGPTGEVFRAKVYGVAGFERQFAIKRFHAQLVSEPDRAAQLAQAARLYGALEHPRIARMHEFGVAGGETFTATELVRGVDLAQLVDATFGSGRPLPAGAAVALLSAAARAVGFAHGRGLAHLGLCPTNVLCTAEGDVKVTDFGFLPLRLPARPSGDPSLHARLPYLAPEQHRGETGTPATDVFQLGLMAYELLRGEPALSGASAAEIEKRALGAEPPPLNLPKALGHAVRRALARSPYERFPDAGAMADALDAAVRATPLPGDRRDLAGLVRNALDQQAQMHENQMSGALRLPVPAPPRPSQQIAAQSPTPARAPSPSPAPPAAAPVTAASAPAGPPAITRRPTPVPVMRTPTPPPTPAPAVARTPTPPPTPASAVARTPTPPPRPAPAAARTPTPPPVARTVTRTPTPAPVAPAASAPPAAPAPPAPAAAKPEASGDPQSGQVTTQMGAVPRPVVPPSSVTGRIPKVAAPALRGAGAVPRPPDSGPGRSGLGSGRSGSTSGPSVPPPTPAAAAAPRRLTPVPGVPSSGQTRPRVATPAPTAASKEAPAPASRADTAASDTEVGTEPGTNVETVTRPAVPVKLTDTQPGTGPTTLPAERSAASARAESEEPGDPFGGPAHESDPDIFAGLFDESPSEEPLFAAGLSRNERPTAGPPAADEPPLPPPDGEVEAAAEGGDDDALPVPAQELEADEPPLLRTLVGHVPITGATNGARPATTSPTRTSNIVPRRRDPAPVAPSRRETDPGDDDGGVTVPRRTASVQRAVETTPPSDPEAFERDGDLRSPIPGASSNILQAAARAADMGLAQPVGAGQPPSTPRIPPGPESVEIEIVRPYLEPELGDDPGPLPGAATLPNMGYLPQAYLPPAYQPPPPVRSRGRSVGKLLLVFLLLAGMGAAGYFGYMAIVASQEGDGEETAATPGQPTPHQPAVAAATAADAGAGAPVVATASDAGAAPQPTPAGSGADAGAPAATAAADLSIDSTPSDAKVYLDGAPVGKTPLHLDATGDRHKLALILPGYKLHTAEIDGKGSVAVELQEVTPSQGPAGIKVKCKEKNRYYVIVDGVDTGQTCPTERIGTEMGEHVVEVYDPENDSRRAFPINIVQTRLSHRVKVDY